MQEFLADVLSLGNSGREEILRRRNTLESLIESGGEYSDICWQTFNEALTEYDRDIQMLDRLKGSDFNKIRARLAILDIIIDRLGKLSNGHAIEPYLEPVVSNLSQLEISGYEGRLTEYKDWLPIVGGGISYMYAALPTTYVQTLPRVAECLVRLSSSKWKLSTLLEIDQLAIKDPGLSDFIKMKVAEFPKTVQLEFWLAKYFADEFEGVPDDLGAPPRDEYIPQAKDLIPLLKQNMLEEQFINAMGSVFGEIFSQDENAQSQNSYLRRAASRVYTKMQPLLTRLDEYRN